MGHEVDLLCGNDIIPGPRQEYVQRHVADQANPPWYRKNRFLAPLVNSVSEAVNIRHDFRLARAVSQRIREFSPDLVLQRSSRLDGRTLQAVLKSGTTAVLEWKDNYVPSPAAQQALRRGDLYGLSLFKTWARRAEQWKEAHANYLVVESGVLRDQLLAGTGRDPDRILVALNAVDAGEFSRDRIETRPDHQLGLPEDAFRAIFVGSFNWYQNVEVLVEAIASPDCPDNVHAILVGDGENRQRVEEHAEQLGLGQRVHFTGRVPFADVPSWLASAHCAVLPDCTEIITPIKVQEYMAMGIPPVIPDYDANREIVDDGKTGLLFAARDPRALARSLATLAGDPESCVTLGGQAARIARERFSWEATWGRVIETIAERAGVTECRSASAV